MDIICYAFENDENELESPFLEYLQKYAPSENESEKTRDKRVKRVINIKEHIKHLISVKGRYNDPPIVKSYKCRKIGNIDEIGVLKIKEGKRLIRIGFITLKDIDKIIIFDVFDKPSLYQKSKKRQVEKEERQFVERIEGSMGDYFKNKLSIPLPIE